MTTLLEEIAAGPLTGSLWNAGPAVFAVEPVACCSVLPHPLMLGGRLRCEVDHAEQGTEKHGAWVGPHSLCWTTAEAASWWARVRRCAADCGTQVPEGVSYCSLRCQSSDKHSPADDYDVEGEAAA